MRMCPTSDTNKEKLMKTPGLLLGLWLLISATAQAADVQATGGPMPGQSFPHTLAASDQNGKAQSLRTLMGPKGLAVFFVRSADWCPFCMGQLVDANRHLRAFKTTGLNVVSISVDEVPLLAEFTKAQGIGYSMLSDPKGAINLTLGIRDVQYPVGSKAFGVPRPTLYIIDARGVVRLRYQEKTYRTRPDLDAVIRDVQALKL
jgi:peroxiredoxin